MDQGWQRIEQLFHRALDQGAGERAAFLEAESRGEPELREAVERLLAAHRVANDLTVRPALGLGDEELATPAPVANRAGERLGAYELIEEIGRGGMATVYRARRTDQAFERDVAIKILRAPLEDREQRQRFQAERQILAGLEHPAIARLYDGGTTPDRAPYFVLELIEGLPIDRYCEAHGCSLGERLVLFRRVCEVVDFAHQRLVVHRDIKPSNLLVDREGQVRLLDFGIAKLIRPSEPLATLTQSDLMPMTPGFASPEQLMGGEVTTASDVFGLGALLYQLVTGSPPFAESFAERIAQTIMDVRARRPSQAAAGDGLEFASDLEGDLDAIIDKALRSDPAQRYPSVEALIADLDRTATGEPVRARQGTWLYLTSRWLRRNRAQMAVAATLIIVSATWAWSARRQSVEIGHQRDAARSEAAKATAASEFLVRLFEGSEPTSVEEGELSARELLARGKERVQRELASQPELRAMMLHNIGRAYERLGFADDALPLLEGALDLRLEAGAPPEVIGQSYLTTANALEALGRFQPAIDAAQEAVARCRLVAAEECLAGALLVLGRAYSAIGEFAPARAALGEARELASRVLDADHEYAAAAVNALGLLAYYERDWETAARHYREAYEFASAEGRAPADAARNANSLGASLLRLGRAEEAIALHQEAYDTLVGLFGPVHENVAGSLGKKAQAQRHLGDLEGAEASARQSIAIQEQIFAPGHPRISFTQAGLAEILAEQGRLPEAEALFRDAVDGMRQAVPDLVQRTGPLTAFASLLIEQGRCVEALPLLEEALGLAATMSPDSEHVVTVTETIARCRRE